MKSEQIKAHNLRCRLVITWDISNDGKGKVTIPNMAVKSYAKESWFDFRWHDHFIGIPNMIKMCYLTEKRLKQIANKERASTKGK